MCVVWCASQPAARTRVLPACVTVQGVSSSAASLPRRRRGSGCPAVAFLGAPVKTGLTCLPGLEQMRPPPLQPACPPRNVIGDLCGRAAARPEGARDSAAAGRRRKRAKSPCLLTSWCRQCSAHPSPHALRASRFASEARQNAPARPASPLHSCALSSAALIRHPAEPPTPRLRSRHGEAGWDRPKGAQGARRGSCVLAGAWHGPGARPLPGRCG